MYYTLCKSEQEARGLIQDRIRGTRADWSATLGEVHDVPSGNLAPAHRRSEEEIARWSEAEAKSGEQSLQWSGRDLSGLVLSMSGPFARSSDHRYAGQANSRLALAWESTES